MDFKLNKSNLNFRVYAAASLPSTAQENDICVISNTPIKNWILSPDAPSGAPRTDGDVWIQYSVTGNTFNALRAGAMMVAAISASQYVNGTWTDKTAKSYLGGEWVDWISYLYNKGDDYTGVTGGWSAMKTAPDSGGFLTAGTCTVDSDSFTLTANSAGTSISRVTNNMIDLTQVSAIYMDISDYTGSSTVFLSCGTQKNIDAEAVRVEQKSTGTLVLDVSGLTGSYYISVTVSCYSGQSGSTAKITQIWYK